MPANESQTVEFIHIKIEICPAPAYSIFREIFTRNKKKIKNPRIMRKKALMIRTGGKRENE